MGKCNLSIHNHQNLQEHSDKWDNWLTTNIIKYCAKPWSSTRSTRRRKTRISNTRSNRLRNWGIKTLLRSSFWRWNYSNCKPLLRSTRMVELPNTMPSLWTRLRCQTGLWDLLETGGELWKWTKTKAISSMEWRRIKVMQSTWSTRTVTARKSQRKQAQQAW